MFAAKETVVLSVAAMGVALVVTVWGPKILQKDTKETKKGGEALWRTLMLAVPWKDVRLGLAATLFVWLLFFSSFFTNFHGLIDSVLTYFPWLKRASGHSPHIHPWY